MSIQIKHFDSHGFWVKREREREKTSKQTNLILGLNSVYGSIIYSGELDIFFLKRQKFSKKIH